MTMAFFWALCCPILWPGALGRSLPSPGGRDTPGGVSSPEGTSKAEPELCRAQLSLALLGVKGSCPVPEAVLRHMRTTGCDV